MKRPHAVIDLPASSRSSPSSVSPVDVISDKNGIPVPVMSATRNFLIRPNANTTPKSLPPQGQFLISLSYWLFNVPFFARNTLLYACVHTHTFIVSGDLIVIFNCTCFMFVAAFKCETKILLLLLVH